MLPYIPPVLIEHLSFLFITENQEEGDSDSDLEEEPQAANAPAQNPDVYCKVMEQKETGDGLVDGECGEMAPPNYAGLCK